jgi:hypothetical protein
MLSDDTASMALKTTILIVNILKIYIKEEKEEKRKRKKKSKVK